MTPIKRSILTDHQRMLWPDDVEGVCPHPDQCVEYSAKVRCGPCAVKQADVHGVATDYRPGDLPEVCRLRRLLRDTENVLAEAELQLEYMDRHSPSGTTPAVVARVQAARAVVQKEPKP